MFNSYIHFTKVVDYSLNNSTINICSLDLSKAFDNLNHNIFYLTN